MTEKEKMLAGMVYDAATPELIAELQNTREVLYEFNTLRPSETLRMKEILKGLFGYPYPGFLHGKDGVKHYG